MKAIKIALRNLSQLLGSISKEKCFQQVDTIFYKDLFWD